MSNQKNYNEYIDEVAETISRNITLTEGTKLIELVNHYRNRLLNAGHQSDQVGLQEKEIREEIKYAETKIRTAFKLFSSSYENEPAFEISIQSIRLREKALSLALSEIITEVEVVVSSEKQYLFDEARRLGWTLEQVENKHKELIEKSEFLLWEMSGFFVNSNQLMYLLRLYYIFPLIFFFFNLKTYNESTQNYIESLNKDYAYSNDRDIAFHSLTSSLGSLKMMALALDAFYLLFIFLKVFDIIKWLKMYSYIKESLTKDFSRKAQMNISRAKKKFLVYYIIYSGTTVLLLVTSFLVDLSLNSNFHIYIWIVVGLIHIVRILIFTVKTMLPTLLAGL